MKNAKKFVGEAVDRIDGLLKVTGAAKYATDYSEIKGAAHAVIFKSTIAAGRILEIETGEAEKSPGVLAVITHRNAPKLNPNGGIRGGGLLQNATVEFHGQHIGVVVAETFEQARHAASLVKVKYEAAEARVDFKKLERSAVKPRAEDRQDALRGDFEKAFQSAERKIEAVYETPIEHHQPMEPHACLAAWDGDVVTVHVSTQSVSWAHARIAATLMLAVTFSAVLKMSGIVSTASRITTPSIGTPAARYAGIVLNACPPPGSPRLLKLMTITVTMNVASVAGPSGTP